MRKLILALGIGAALAGGLVACGGDDDNIVQIMADGGPGTDGSPNTGNDGSPNTGNDGSPMGDDDGGDGGTGCAFTDFVNNAVTNSTNSTSAPLPITSIGDPSCSYTGTPFSGLFK